MAEIAPCNQPLHDVYSKMATTRKNKNCEENLSNEYAMMQRQRAK
jgi:hypothetical protein